MAVARLVRSLFGPPPFGVCICLCVCVVYAGGRLLRGLLWSNLERVVPSSVSPVEHRERKTRPTRLSRSAPHVYSWVDPEEYLVRRCPPHAFPETPPAVDLAHSRLSYDIELTGDGRDDLLAAAPSSPSSPSSSGAGHLVGKVLSLRCGHNNLYSESERRMLLEHLALEG